MNFAFTYVIMSLVGVTCGPVKRSDDVMPLEGVVQQQAALLQSQQAKLTALESKVDSLEAGKKTSSKMFYLTDIFGVCLIVLIRTFVHGIFGWCF